MKKLISYIKLQFFINKCIDKQEKDTPDILHKIIPGYDEKTIHPQKQYMPALKTAVAFSLVLAVLVTMLTINFNKPTDYASTPTDLDSIYNVTTNQPDTTEPTLSVQPTSDKTTANDNNLPTEVATNPRYGTGQDYTRPTNRPIDPTRNTSIPTTIFIENKKIKFATVSAGDVHSVGIDIDGSLWAWGPNYHGQLGDGTNKNKTRPVKIIDDVIYATAGTDNTFAIRKDNSLWGWGGNEYGQLGDGTNINQSKPVKIMNDVVAVSAYGYHTAVIKKDGTLWVWGMNTNGEIGDGTTNNRNRPVKIMDDVIDIATSLGNTAAIKKDKSLWAWGYTNEGVLTFDKGSNDNISSCVSPVKIMENVVSINLAWCNAYVIKTDGNLWGWGHNSMGQLGNDKFDIYYTAEKPLKIMDDVEEVSAGSWNTIAIKKDGSLWFWGSHPTLGGGHEYDNVQSVPIKIMENAKKVSAGNNHVFIIKNDGSLWVFGTNMFGEFGNGTEKNTTKIPIQIFE